MLGLELELVLVVVIAVSTQRRWCPRGPSLCPCSCREKRRRRPCYNRSQRADYSVPWFGRAAVVVVEAEVEDDVVGGDAVVVAVSQPTARTRRRRRGRRERVTKIQQEEQEEQRMKARQAALA